MSPQPTTKCQNKPICLSGCECEFCVLLINISRTSHGLWMKCLLLTLKDDHVSIIYLIWSPMLMPSWNHLTQTQFDINYFKLMMRMTPFWDKYKLWNAITFKIANRIDKEHIQVESKPILVKKCSSIISNDLSMTNVAAHSQVITYEWPIPSCIFSFEYQKSNGPSHWNSEMERTPPYNESHCNFVILNSTTNI